MYMIINRVSNENNDYDEENEKQQQQNLGSQSC